MLFSSFFSILPSSYFQSFFSLFLRCFVHLFSGYCSLFFKVFLFLFVCLASLLSFFQYFPTIFSFISFFLCFPDSFFKIFILWLKCETNIVFIYFQMRNFRYISDKKKPLNYILEKGALKSLSKSQGNAQDGVTFSITLQT